MALTLGRLGLATGSGGDGRTLLEPFEWAQNGQQITLQGVYKASSDADAVSFANGITGLDPALSDDNWIPITSSLVSGVDGYYKVLGSQAGFGRASLGTGTLLVDWQVTVERPRLFRQPRIEIATSQSGLTNGMSVTTATSLFAMPTGALTRIASSYGSASPTTGTRSPANGNVDIYYFPGYTISGSGSTTSWGLSVAPGSYYNGSASISDSVGVMHGRRDIAIASAYTVGNGLIRIAPTATDLNLSWWTGSAWSTARSLQLCHEASGTTYAWTMNSCQVLRNSPLECILRLAGTSTVTYGGEVSIDVSIRRGERLARIVGTSQNSVAGMQIRFGTSIAATSITYGIRNTTALSSEYIILTSDYASTKTTTAPGKLTNASARVRNLFCAGVTLGGSATGTGLDDGLGIGQQCYTVYGESEQVVFG